MARRRETASARGGGHTASDGEAVAGDHPLRSAAWIWPEGVLYLHNHYAHFRKDFDLASVPRRAPLFVTADKSYKLYVNGRFVCRGPARGYQSHWSFDELDVAEHLRRGHNWIAAEAYNPGISTFQYLHQAQAGFLLAARWGDVTIATDDTWTMQRSPGHLTDTARYSLQMDFQEHLDARALSRAWISSGEQPGGFSRSPFVGAAHYSFPYGRPPWESLEPRGIPLMRERIVTPVAVTSSASGESDESCRSWQNVSWGWISEEGRLPEWLDGSCVPHQLRGEWLELTLPACGPDRFSAATVDFGAMIVGNLVVEAEGAAGGEIVDFQHYPILRSGRPQFLPPGQGCLVAMANRLGLAAGTTQHEFFHLLCFRHVTVVARDLAEPLTLRLKARSAGYPFAMGGSFACSDPTLVKIHDACRATQQLCALDAYVDTPWREQAQWWGDARVQAKNTFYLDGDARLLARGIRSIAGQSTSQGLTYGHAPTMAHNCILPDFSLTWILTIWDHYWQTGLIDLFLEQLPRVRQVLGYFDTPDARARGGLLRHDRRLWYFGDWADLYRGEVPTFLNMWYLLTLRTVARMLRVAKLRDEAARVEKRAALHERAVVRSLFDAKAKLFSDGLDASGAREGRHSVHEQTLALMLDLAPKAHAAMVAERLLPYLRGEKLPCAVPSAFWCTYVLETMAVRGHGEDVVAFIRRRWEPMLSTMTTWEGFEWDESSGSSCSHAWTAHPSYHLVNTLAGLTQTAPGWTAVRFAPLLSALVDRVRAVVPTPLGELTTSWERSKKLGVRAKLRLPRGVTARVEFGGVRTTVAGGREHSFCVED